MIKELIIDMEDYKIYVDMTERIRIEIINTEKKELVEVATKLSICVNKINNLPLGESLRNRYKQDIVNIYQVGILNDLDQAERYAKDLEADIKKNLILEKKCALYLPVIILYLLIIFVIAKCQIFINYKSPLIFGSIGGILSAIYQNSTVDLDYVVENKILYFEAIKLVLLSNLTAIIGMIALNCGLLLSGFIANSEGTSIEPLVYTVCGYSQTFIVNLLQNFEADKT